MSTVTASKQHPLTEWSGTEIVERYLEWLPAPRTEAQEQAKAAIEAKQFDTCKVLAVCHLEDNYIKAIGYLSSVEKVCAAGLPTLPTLASEAARAIADALCDSAVEKGDIKDLDRDSARKIWLMELNEINRNIFKKALKAAND